MIAPDAVSTVSYPSTNIICFMYWHQAQKGPLNDNGFLPSFSGGFLDTPETSALTSRSEDRSRPWASYSAPRPGYGLVRRVPAPRAAGLCRCRHSVGRRRIERPATATRPLQLVRQEGRNDPTSRLGRKRRRLSAVSDMMIGPHGLATLCHPSHPSCGRCRTSRC